MEMKSQWTNAALLGTQRNAGPCLLGLQTLFSVLIATPSPHRERQFRDCDVYQLPLIFPFHFTRVILTPWALGALTIWTLCSATGGEWNRSLLHRSDEAAEQWVPSSYPSVAPSLESLLLVWMTDYSHCHSKAGCVSVPASHSGWNFLGWSLALLERSHSVFLSSFLPETLTLVRVFLIKNRNKPSSPATR